MRVGGRGVGGRSVGGGGRVGGGVFVGSSGINWAKSVKVGRGRVGVRVDAGLPCVTKTSETRQASNARNKTSAIRMRSADFFPEVKGIALYGF